MTELRGQEQAPMVQPPERPSVAPAAPPVSSGAQPFSDAIRVLTALRYRVEGETWVVAAMKRPVLTGIRMCIHQLEREAEK